MKDKMFAMYKKLPVPFRSFCKVMQRYLLCLKNGHGLKGIKVLWKIISSQSKVFVDEYYQQSENIAVGYTKKYERLSRQTKGLHAIMSEDNQYSYSVLIALDNPSSNYFYETLQSALQLNAPKLEILIAYKNSESKKIIKILEDFHQLHPERLRIIKCSDEESSHLINILVENAQGNMLLIIGQEDIPRCDILFRYEQILRLSPDNKKIVMFCKEYQIQGEADDPTLDPESQENVLLNFPYIFSNIIQNSLLIPRPLWDLTGGIGKVDPGMEIFDISLKLDLVGAMFCCFSYPLYGYRHSKCFQESSKKLLQDYVEHKGLDWAYSQGFTPHSYRVIPEIKSIPKIQVVMPFKNQKELTLRAVKSILNQKGVQTLITAVDNGSEDRTIGIEIEKLGGEVLLIDEPFNYSRLNNQALKRSTLGAAYDLVLFINNDVELEEGALEEMARWINQPAIGIVGCRLNYPNGLLQHGGVKLDMNSPASKMIWEHVEKKFNFSQLKLANVLGVVDSLTAACVLMKKSVFFEVGGFDEIWYPIRYSDTTLTEKIKNRGYHCFYTPYALGIHHESISRDQENIEGVECSSWFYAQWSKNHLTKDISIQKNCKDCAVTHV